MKFKKFLAGAVAIALAAVSLPQIIGAADDAVVTALDGQGSESSGTEIAVDQSKVLWGDFEKKGNLRIELYNQYGPTKDAPAIDVSDVVDAYSVWNVSDAVITSDGTYTVSFEKNIIEDGLSGPEKSWSVLKLQTNISQAEHPDLSITVDSLKIDGVEIESGKSALLGTDPTKPDAYSDINGITVSDAYAIGFFNLWNPDQTVIEATDFGGRVEVTFTLTGLNNEEESEGSETTTSSATEAPTPSTTTTAATAASTTTTTTNTTTTQPAPAPEVIDEDEDTGVQLMAAEGVIEEGVELNVVIGSADIDTDAHLYVLDITLTNAQGVTV